MKMIVGKNWNKDTQREKAKSKRTPMLIKSRIMGIQIVGASNQLFIKGSQTKTELKKTK